MRAIAFYLPQYHPIPENDEWWGKGFTEWTNVRKTKPLYPGHLQPKTPGELGYYDLRDASARQAQAQLARAAGISGFCYWHYWFAGERLLERPFNEVLQTGQPDFPFCLGWANESWAGVWHGNPDQILKQQSYPGADDEQRHFEWLTPAFHDPRYLRMHDKPIFYIYKPRLIPDCRRFVDHWQNLAVKAGLKGVYFIGEDVQIDHDPWDYKSSGFDAVSSNSPGVAFLRLAQKRFEPRYLLPRLVHKLKKQPVQHKYADFIDHNLVDPGHQDFYPSVVPNWDNTPRVGRNGFVLTGSTPELFKCQLQAARQQVEARPADQQLIFIKSWNEWAEGNYLEPDQQYGHGYLEVCREVLSDVALTNR